jgi:TonB family protein
MPASNAAGLTRPGIIALCVLSGLSAPVWAADGIGASASGSVPAEAGMPELAGQAHDAELDFDIPAQALTAALKEYAGLTLQSTIFRSEIVAGKTSTPVHGRYSAEAALRLLLADTGLVVEKMGSGPTAAFVLKIGGGAVAAAARKSPRSLAGYPSLVQTRVWETLCSDLRTMPGEYRMLLRFRVDAAGRVQRPSLLNSTGDPYRDAAVLEILQRVQLAVPPPPDMRQPVTMLILPRAPGVAQHCGAGASRHE